MGKASSWRSVPLLATVVVAAGLFKTGPQASDLLFLLAVAPGAFLLAVLFF